MPSSSFLSKYIKMKIINKKIIKKNIDYIICVRPITVIDIQVCKSFIVKLLISTLGFFTKKEKKHA